MQKREFNAGAEHLRVAIAGFDMEGKATYQYLSQKPGVDITVLDERDVNVPGRAIKLTGPDVFNTKLDFDQVWRTPGLSPYKLQTDGEVTSGTIEFFKLCPAPIIGVTGTKGKGTTASLIAAILRESKKTVHLLGNIGQPALSVLPDIKPEDIVVFELSSFQLWDLKSSPQVAVILMIEPDHLDVHQDQEDYLRAKSNIARWQGPEDKTIFLAENPMTTQVASVGMGKKIPIPGGEGAVIADGRLSIDGQEICQASQFGLLGEHNHANIIAALTAAWQFDKNPQAAATAIIEFKGLPHRLQLIANKNGIDFVDDSISTTPTSAIAALRSFEGPRVIILGGSDKGADYQYLANELAATQDVKVVLIGQTADKIQAELDKAGFNEYDRVSGGMSEIVRTAAGMLKSQGTVLLSPACASFDMFKDYNDRADKFARAVEGL